MDEIRSLEDIEIIDSELLGQGYIAQVKRARHRRTGMTYAVKIIDLQRASPEERVALRREVRIQKTLAHQNVVRLIASFERDGRMFIFLELLQKSLFDFINSVRFDESLFLRLFYEVVKAVVYLHSKRIIHRDIKPENVLMTGQLTAKLCDFGFCAQLEEGIRKTKCGTAEYLPPEILKGEAQTDKVDIWCLGVLLYEITHKTTPFKARNFDAMLEMIKRREIAFNSRLNPSIRSIIEGCLNETPSKRPTALQLFNDRLFDQFRPIIRTNSVVNLALKSDNPIKFTPSELTGMHRSGSNVVLSKTESHETRKPKIYKKQLKVSDSESPPSNSSFLTNSFKPVFQDVIDGYYIYPEEDTLSLTPSPSTKSSQNVAFVNAVLPLPSQSLLLKRK